MRRRQFRRWVPCYRMSNNRKQHSTCTLSKARFLHFIRVCVALFDDHRLWACWFSLISGRRFGLYYSSSYIKHSPKASGYAQPFKVLLGYKPHVFRVLRFVSISYSCNITLADRLGRYLRSVTQGLNPRALSSQLRYGPVCNPCH